jgi:hypothetical protein
MVYKIEKLLGHIASNLSAAMAVIFFIFGTGHVFYREGIIKGTESVPFLVIAQLMLIVSAVLGYVGISMLKKDNKKGGIFFIIAGALALLPSYLDSGMYGIFFMALPALFFISGIMALTKKVSA